MANINSMCIVIYANNTEETLSVANDANKHVCQGKMQCTLVEHLYDNEWLVILAKNADHADRARDKYYEEKN